jgi:hypothetical protein
MKRKINLVTPAWLSVVGLACLAACSDPYPPDTTPPEEEEICAASADWLPDTPGMQLFKPLPHPAGECPFYRGGWQNFLIATQPDAQGVPAIRSFATIDDTFVHSKALPANRAWLGDIKQAGGRQILVDQNGNSLYYGIHFNKAFVDFVNKNNLRTKDGIVNADPNLFFPAGVVEYKSAWQVVEGNMPTDNWITVKTTVPTLGTDAQGNLTEDRNTPRTVTLRLLALHSVFTLPGHPEFIWATFAHIDDNGDDDIAPHFTNNPDLADPYNLKKKDVVAMKDLVLYKAGTAADSGNQPIAEKDLKLDKATQKFTGQQTSIYRMFPASKSNTTHADDAISSLNFNVAHVFKTAVAAGKLSPNDKRMHYKLIGAVWMDKPAHFKLDKPLQNDESSPFAHESDFLKSLQEEGSDSAFSILAGEDRLSSTAMESFTQGPASFPNCFSCHNTQAVTAKGVPLNKDRNGVKLLDPKLINVSHVFSQFLLDDAQ